MRISPSPRTLGLSVLFLPLFTIHSLPAQPPRLEIRDLEGAARTAGLEFSPGKLRMMLGAVLRRLQAFERIRKEPLPNSLYPALVFHPVLPGIAPRPWAPPPRELALPRPARPENLEDLAFADIPTLASLVRSRKVTCLELARLFLARLKKLDGTLHCVITYTEKRALEQARKLDEELAAGKWRGPLHGIPYGVKDLLAVKGYPTTWGAAPFKKQVIDEDATVVRKLDEAGAVLVAKLTLGALAMGDVWFGGKTRNPWKPSQGSSGSSAGPAAAVAAGGVVFAVGSETLGSIVSPSARCGCTSLRPTFGRVSRHGAMALSWSMDKLGPLCRSALDAALVFRAILGPDGLDPSVLDMPFRVPLDVDPKGWKVGFLPGLVPKVPYYRKSLEEMRALGVKLVPIRLPDLPARSLTFILNVEAAAAFDELTRSGRDAGLTRQGKGAWPNIFRAARLVPAVEYIQANRARVLLMREMDRVMSGVDAIIHPPFGPLLSITNLTGHPTVTAPCGFRKDGTPRGMCWTGALGGEARLLALVQAWQARTAYHEKHPDL